MNQMVGWMKMNGKIKRSRNLPLSEVGWCLQAKTPWNSDPHSFNNDCWMLYMTPLLISDVFDKRLSMLITTTFDKLSVG